MNDSKLKRKNSSDSERSLASLTTLMTESKSQTKDVIELQKKMKVLRAGVLRERQEKEVLEKSKNEFAAEVERLRIQLQEKDAYCLKLRTENADLNDKLQIERKKAENFAQQSNKGSTSISGVFGDLFGNNKKEDEYKKLLTDYNYMRKQLEVVLEKSTKSETNADQQRRENKQQIENLQKKLAERDKELEDKVHAYIALGHKNQDLTAQNETLMKEKNKIEEELRKARKELDSVKNERDELERSNVERLRTMNEMNEVCEKMEKEIVTLTEKITQLQAELEESELKLQVFDLKKVGKIVETPAQMLLRKNISNEHIIEIENGGERMTIYPQSIQSFGLLKETEDKFYIEYKGLNGRVQKDTFVSSDRKRVLKHLMTLVKTGQENKTSSESKKNSVVDKNIFSQVVSFFGN